MKLGDERREVEGRGGEGSGGEGRRGKYTSASNSWISPTMRRKIIQAKMLQEQMRERGRWLDAPKHTLEIRHHTKVVQQNEIRSVFHLQTAAATAYALME